MSQHHLGSSQHKNYENVVTHPREIWGIQTPPVVPATFFINPNGELVLSLFKPQTKDKLNEIIMEIKKTF